MTGRDLVTASLRLIGAIAPGESLEASEATDGLASINRMISSWSTEGFLIHTVTAETPLLLTASDATYTMGTSGDITTRPQSFEAAVIRDASSSIDQPPMNWLTAAEYAAISDKTTTAAYPTHIYDDGGFPQRTLKLWPVPSAANYLVLFTRRALTEISTLDTSISLPPGYERALVYNAAVELSPEYGKLVPDQVLMIAVESKASIKRMNEGASILQCDPAVVLVRGGYNIFSGSYN